MSIIDKIIFDPTKASRPPVTPLENAVTYLKKLVATGGTNGSYDDLSRAFGTSGIVSGTFMERLYALKNYGFIETNNKSYRITSLGLDLVHPDNEQGEIQAVQAGFKRFDMLRTIWEGYRSQILPAKEYLPNALGKKFGIPDDRKEGWANYFLKSVQFARLVEERPSGLYVIDGPPTDRSFKNNFPVAHRSTNESGEPEIDTSRVETSRANNELLQPIERPSKAQNTAELIDELSGQITTGIKLHRKVGNSYILLYLDSAMTKDEATDFENVLERLSEAAKPLLSLTKGV